MINRRHLLVGSAAAASAIAAGAAAQTPPPRRDGPFPPGLADPVETIDLWPEGAINRTGGLMAETVSERSTDPQITDRAVLSITRPRMVVFRPDRPNGAAVLVTPGGGYRWVVIDKEGYEVARWLAARGFTVFVLFYRLPGDEWDEGADAPLADAQRAMRLIRARSRDYGVDPDRIAAMGFSAGGHVCADLAVRFDASVRTAIDATDQLNARPMVAAPIYPVISMSAPDAHAGSRRQLLGPDPDAAAEHAHSPHLNVSDNAPPHFILHAQDDDVVPVNNALLLNAALRERGVPVELHLFQEGGHGFGLRRAIGKPVEVWPELFRAWARARGLG